MIPLLAQVGGAVGWSFGQVVIAVIVVAACVAVLFIALRVFGVTIPQWVWQIVGVCVAAFVAIVAVKFLLGL